MADLKDIEAALRAADAAGNVEDARKLAAAYAKAKASSESPERWNNVQAPRGGSTEEDYSPTKRGLGLGARSTVEGVAGIVDLLTSPLRGGAELLGMDRPGTLTELVGKGADKLGLPRANNARERVQSDVGRAISGGAVTMGAGGAMAQLPNMAGRVGTALSAQPVLQTLSNATGAGASGITRESGGSQGA